MVSLESRWLAGRGSDEGDPLQGMKPERYGSSGHDLTICQQQEVTMFRVSLCLFIAAVCLTPCLGQAQQQPPQAPHMTFFVTSAGSGKGGDLGGLEGAEFVSWATGFEGAAGVFVGQDDDFVWVQNFGGLGHEMNAAEDDDFGGCFGGLL